MGDERFVPAWSDYHSRGFYPEATVTIFYADITSYLTKAHNTIEIRVETAGTISVRTCEGNMVYGTPKIKLLPYKTVTSFQATETPGLRGPIVYNQIYIGEIYDANILRQSPVELTLQTYADYDSVARLQNIPCDRIMKEHRLFLCRRY